MKPTRADSVITSNFKCLRSNHAYTGPYDKKVLQERTCPKCGSNSVRRLKGKSTNSRAKTSKA